MNIAMYIFFSILFTFLAIGITQDKLIKIEKSPISTPEYHHKYFMVDGMQCIQFGNNRSRSISCDWKTNRGLKK